MCGLVGIAGDTTGFRKDMFAIMLVVDQLRGMHSTGVAAVRRYLNNEFLIAKEPGGPSNLMNTKEFKSLMETQHKVLIGHNRFATVGGHTTENAHPFQFEHLVGAHNGTIENDDRKSLHLNEMFGTDSEAIFCHMNQYGLDDTIDKLRGWSSAYALTWYDRPTNTINFLRNSKRPLMYAYSKDRTTLIWASELDFILFAAKRAHIQLQNDEIYNVEDDTHCSWEVPKGVNDKFPGVTKTIVKPRFKTVEPVVHKGVGHWIAGSWFPDEKEDYSSVTYPAKKKTDRNDEFIFGSHHRKDTKKWRPPYKDSKGNVLNKRQFDEMVTQQGCVFCGTCGQNWGEFIQPFKSAGTKDYDYLCETCYNDEETYELIHQLI